MKTKPTFLTSLSILTVALMVGAGCASSGYKQGDQTSASARKAADKISSIGPEIDAALAALADLSANPAPDLRPQFKTFTTAHDKVIASGKAIKSETDAMNSRGAAYFAKWDKELAKIVNDDIRTRATDRRTAMADKFDRVKASYEEVKATYTPFANDLKDLRVLLAADLTRGGVLSIGDVVKRSQGESVKLKASLEKLSGDFKALSEALASQQAAEAPPAAK